MTTLQDGRLQDRDALMVRGSTSIDRQIGHRLRERREAAGLSHEDLASRLGVSVAELLMFEAGDKPIPPARLIQAAEALKTPLHGLLEGASEGNCGHDLSRTTKDVIRFLAMPEAYALIDAFLAVPSRTERLRIVDDVSKRAQRPCANISSPPETDQDQVGQSQNGP